MKPCKWEGVFTSFSLNSLHYPQQFRRFPPFTSQTSPFIYMQMVAAHSAAVMASAFFSHSPLNPFSFSLRDKVMMWSGILYKHTAREKKKLNSLTEWRIFNEPEALMYFLSKSRLKLKGIDKKKILFQKGNPLSDEWTLLFKIQVNCKEHGQYGHEKKKLS